MTNVTIISPERILQLGTAFWASKTLLSAIEIGLFSELAAAGPLDADAIGRRLGLHERSTRDFLDALVSVGMLQRGEHGAYANTRKPSSTSMPASHPMSAASWRWRISGCTRIGGA